jgi:formate dehydrogenase gamma subunit
MEQRTVRRFRASVILIHWLHMLAFSILAITGSLMFFNLTDFGSGPNIRTIHLTAAFFFTAVPIVFSFLEPGTSLMFLKEAFQWNKGDTAWLKSSIGYYFRDNKELPAQGRINGDQRLWQLVVVTTSTILILTGAVLWFFKFRIPRLAFQGLLLGHSIAFVVVSVAFFWHFYLRTLFPDFGESLSSMIDGRVSESYVSRHYRNWRRATPADKADSSK